MIVKTMKLATNMPWNSFASPSVNPERETSLRSSAMAVSPVFTNCMPRKPGGQVSHGAFAAE
jgi:hypothetical protein